MSKGDRIPFFLTVIDAMISKADELAKEHGVNNLKFDLAPVMTIAEEWFYEISKEISKKTTKDIQQINYDLKYLYDNHKKNSVGHNGILSQIDDLRDIVETYAESYDIKHHLSFDKPCFIEYVKNYITSVRDAIIAKTGIKKEQVDAEYRMKFL